MAVKSMAHTTQSRRLPYPYKAMVAICKRPRRDAGPERLLADRAVSQHGREHRHGSRREPGSGQQHLLRHAGGLGLLRRGGLEVITWVYTPDMELDARLHRILPSVVAYLPRTILFSISPGSVVRTLGGVGLMDRCVLDPVRAPAEHEENPCKA